MSYPQLSQSRINEASHLELTTYGLAGYESVAQYFAEYPIGAADAVFSWQATAGAVYTVQSTSYADPGTLLVYDSSGTVIAEDDASGLPGSDHITLLAPYSGSFFVAPSWRQGDGEGQHGVTLSVYEDLNPAGAPILAGGAGGDVLNGTPGAEAMLGREGADMLGGLGGDDFLDGGTGLDSAVYGAARANYELLSFGDRFLVTDQTGADGRDLLWNVERLAFPDVSVAIDLDGAGGKAARIYQAAFNRAPDLVGLGFWIYHMDRGTALESVANGFIGSPEFRSLYGESPSNYDLVYRFYLNVLHREPDPGGFAFWLHALDYHIATPAQVLIGFSESPENYTQVIETMLNGIPFIPWG